MWSHNTILHSSRIKLNLTFCEYLIIDTIGRSQGNPKYSKNGWCTLSFETLAGYFGYTKQGALKAKKNLIEKGLLEVNGKLKRATIDWFNSLEISQEEIKDSKKGKLSLPKTLEQKGKLSLPTKGKLSLPKTPQNGKLSLPHKERLNKDKKEDSSISAKSQSSSYQILSDKIESSIDKAIRKKFSNGTILDKFPNAVKLDVPTMISEFKKYWIEKKGRGVPTSKNELARWQRGVQSSFQQWAEIESQNEDGNSIIKLDLSDSDNELLESICKFWFSFFRKEPTATERNIISNRIIQNGLTYAIAMDLINQAYQATEEQQRVKVIFEEKFEKFLSYVSITAIPA